MAFDTITDSLIVMHSLEGIFQVDLKTGKKTQLVSAKDVVGDDVKRPIRLFNSIAVAKNGDFYFSHSSSEYEINRVMMTAFPNPSGRLIHLSRGTGKMKVLLDKLWFANGVAISPNEDFVVVAESFASRLMRVWLTGPRAGSSEVFFDGMPGAPDNLSFDDEGIWAPLASAADDQHPMLNHLLAPYPIGRKFLVRLLELIKMPFEFINSIYPNRLASFVAREFGSMDMILFILPPRRTVLRFDWNAKVIKCYHGLDKSTGTVTHVMKLDDHLYLGSVTSDFIGRVQI